MHIGSGNCLRLALYDDDFGVTDLLGNKVSKYKVGGVYFTILNVPPHLRSRLCGIFLTLLCKSEDIKAFGWSVILEWLITDVKQLRDIGIVVHCADRSTLNVTGVISCLVGDNIALHGIGGFTESFSGGRCCRTCTSSLLEQQTRYEESECCLRDKESFFAANH